MSRQRPGNEDLLIGIASLSLVGVGWYRLRMIPFQKLEAGLGPAFFPAVVLVLVTTLALVIVIRGAVVRFRSPRMREQAAGSAVKDDSSDRAAAGGFLFAILRRPVTKMIALFVVYSFVFRYAGFLIASAAYLVPALSTLGVKMRFSVVISAVTVAGLYVVFVLIFRIRLT